MIQIWRENLACKFKSLFASFIVCVTATAMAAAALQHLLRHGSKDAGGDASLMPPPSRTLFLVSATAYGRLQSKSYVLAALLLISP